MKIIFRSATVSTLDYVSGRVIGTRRFNNMSYRKYDICKVCIHVDIRLYKYRMWREWKTYQKYLLIAHFFVLSYSLMAHIKLIYHYLTTHFSKLCMFPLTALVASKASSLNQEDFQYLWYHLQHNLVPLTILFSFCLSGQPSTSWPDLDLFTSLTTPAISLLRNKRLQFKRS